MDDNSWLSCFYVEKLGFEKIGVRKWVKEKNILEYDGTLWILNGTEKIRTVGELKRKSK